MSICRRCFFISGNNHQINEQIRDREVLLIGEEGEKVGVMSSHEALNTAAAKGLDLVKIAPQANPPVCRIMDYGRFRFEQAKKDKEARKNQKVVDIKEVRLSPGIGDHDFGFKLKNAQTFLSDGDKVKVYVRFRGREMAHTELGTELLTRFAESCAEVAVIEKPAKLEGRQMIMFLAPKAPAK